MDQLEKKWRRYHYKNLTIFAVSLVLGLALLKHPDFRYLVLHVGTWGYIGAFFCGILFVSTFTASFATALLLLLAETLNPLELGILAGLGSVMGDLIIFRYVRGKGFADEVQHIITLLGGNRLKHLVHTKYFAWTLPVMGAIIIASPLPDELGVGLLGISRMKTSHFVALSFILNTVGIMVIVIAGSVFKP